MKTPDWQTNFRNLPEIPKYKQWNENLRSTTEQDIAYKLLNRITINQNEINTFLELTNYYTELYEKLTTLDYSTFSSEEIENFKNYIFYAFNYEAILTNGLTIKNTYRLVVNENVTGKNQRITDLSYLKYPNLAIVKKTGKYNRSNSPNTTVFYSAENIDTVLKEVRPPLNKLVTVGIWKPKTQRQFISYPIFLSDDALINNEGANKAMNAFEKYFQSHPPLFIEYMRQYFKLLGREYSKKINHNNEYIISALFSERILSTKSNSSPVFDCIIYPSVGNEHITDNIALKPNVLDKEFYLKKVIEFEVEDAHYDNKFMFTEPETITLAKVKNLASTYWISPKGKISWRNKKS